LRDTIIYGQQNYNKIDNIRIHFTDIREDPRKPGITGATRVYDHSVEQFLMFVNKIKDSIKDRDIDLLDIFFNFAGKAYLAFLTNSYQIIKEGRKSEIGNYFSSDMLLDSVINIRDKDRYIYNIFEKRIGDIISDFLHIYINRHSMRDNFNPKSGVNISTMLDNLYRIYIMGLNAGAGVSDMYTLSMIHSSDDYKNCILYYGNAHYEMILKPCLLDAGYKLVKEFRSDLEGDMRCIRDIIPFDKFFNKN
jgi:hypothetical protein